MHILRILTALPWKEISRLTPELVVGASSLYKKLSSRKGAHPEIQGLKRLEKTVARLEEQQVQLAKLAEGLAQQNVLLMSWLKSLTRQLWIAMALCVGLVILNVVALVIGIG